MVLKMDISFFMPAVTTGLILLSLQLGVHCQQNIDITVPDALFTLPEIIDEDIDTDTMIAINQIITPSDKCKEIVGRFASAISNFTLCSVTNARPIHLCEWCISQYLIVVETHHVFLVTIDEKGNPCREYFTNLDRIEIVSDAYQYVQTLWRKGKCDYCFQKNETTGAIIPRVTEEVVNFESFYELAKSCFNLKRNDTCIKCKFNYEKMNGYYIDIVDKYGENVCLDVVDTMNTTREIWSQIFHCIPERNVEIYLHIGMAVVAVVPLIFYFLAYVLSSKQEARVLQRRRLQEIFSVTSNSGATDVSGYISSRLGRSTSTNTSTDRSVPTAPNTAPNNA